LVFGQAILAVLIAAAKHGDVVVLEGDATLISELGGALGIRVDAERNDLAAITARIAAEAIDEDAVLVLFTTFDDRGAGGPAYFVPFFNDVLGTGMGEIDRRAEFGVEAFVGVANMKQRASHPQLELDAAHEIAHRHLAYFPPPMPRTSTAAVDILGRQSAHWHALLHSDASLMGGHELREVEPGRFTVVSRYARFSELDLYGLGLLAPEEVAPFFFVAGSPIPEAAELEPGTMIEGRRIDLTIDDVVLAAGPRDPGEKELRLVFALLTRPGESATSTSANAEAELIDLFRGELESEWIALTRSRGRLCTRLDGCLVPETPDAGMIIDPKTGDCGCAAVPSRGEGAGSSPALLLVLLIVWIRCRGRERSCGRSSLHASLQRRGARQRSH
jgi:hypothetical protein